MKPVRKGMNPIRIPFQLRSTSKAMASWANDVRVGMQQLRDRVDQYSTPKNGRGSRPLKAYVNGITLRITPGYVNGIMPTISGTALNAATPPVLTLSEGANFLHLIGDYQPTVYELVTGYAAIGSAGTVAAPEFVLTASSTPSPAESYPIVSGGAGVDGNFDILWAKFTRTGSVVTVDIPSGGGDAEVVFMPPNLYVAFRDVERSA
jgi:hypothetical protein